MTYFECIECGNPFMREADQEWKRKCLTCWRRSRPQAQQGTTRGDVALEWYRRGYAAGREEAQALAQGEPLLDRAKLRELTQLCHPDKHDGSPLAERVTAWLNDLKRGLSA